MTITCYEYNVWPQGRPSRTFRTLAKARRWALQFGDGAKINKASTQYHSDGSRVYSTAGHWVLWESRFIRDPRENRPFRRARVLRLRPNKRHNVCGVVRPFGFSPLLECRTR